MLPGARRPARRHPQGQRARHGDHLPRAAHAGQDAGTAYAAVIPAYVVVALIFIVINYGLTVLAGRVERRINRRGRARRRHHHQRHAGRSRRLRRDGEHRAGRRQRAEPRPTGLTGHRGRARTRLVRALPRGVLPRLDSNQHPDLLDSRGHKRPEKTSDLRKRRFRLRLQLSTSGRKRTDFAVRSDA